MKQVSKRASAKMPKQPATEVKTFSPRAATLADLDEVTAILEQMENKLQITLYTARYKEAILIALVEFRRWVRRLIVPWWPGEWELLLKEAERVIAVCENKLAPLPELADVVREISKKIRSNDSCSVVRDTVFRVFWDRSLDWIGNYLNAIESRVEGLVVSEYNPETMDLDTIAANLGFTFEDAKEILERAATTTQRETTERTADEPRSGAAGEMRLKWGKDRQPGENPVRFTARAYAAEITGGTFDKSLIRRDDKTLYQRLFRDKAWDELAAFLASKVPTKSQRRAHQRDLAMQALGIDEAEAARVIAAAVKRPADERKKSNPRRALKLGSG